jgi:amidohydrolase
VSHERLDRAVTSVTETVVAMARDVFTINEVAREEVRSSQRCAEVLAANGFTVQFGDGALETAFVATWDSGRPGPRIGILAEYDALPGIGHACGHNLIAGASVAAGVSLARAGVAGGTVQVFGCPAEEIGFGKPAMLRAGMLDGIHAALSFHGAPYTAVMASCKALRARSYYFTGQPAHAGDAPWLGRSALDAVIGLFNATNAFRQFTEDGERLHGVIPQGGDAYNVVPEHAEARFGVRAGTVARADQLLARVDACAQAAALATETVLKVGDDLGMDDLSFHAGLSDLITHHLESVGLEPGRPCAVGASTDVGNVSKHVPTALVYVQTWSPGTKFHTAQARAESDTPAAYEAMLRGARVMARTAWDVLHDPESHGVDPVSPLSTANLR